MTVVRQPSADTQQVMLALMELSVDNPSRTFGAGSWQANLRTALGKLNVYDLQAVASAAVALGATAPPPWPPR